MAAYNAGEHNVDIWVRARGGGRLRPRRHPVPGDARLRDERVKHQKAYRKKYAHELGLK